MCVCLSVRHNMLKISLEKSISIFLGQRAVRQHLEHQESTQRANTEHSESNQRTLREQSESTQRALRASKLESIQSEPINTASCWYLFFIYFNFNCHITRHSILGSDCIDSYFDALIALWLLSDCSLSALWVLTDCWLIPDWLLKDLSQKIEGWLLLTSLGLTDGWTKINISWSPKLFQNHEYITLEEGSIKQGQNKCLAPSKRHSELRYSMTSTQAIKKLLNALDTEKLDPLTKMRMIMLQRDAENTLSWKARHHHQPPSTNQKWSTQHPQAMKMKMRMRCHWKKIPRRLWPKQESTLKSSRT